MDSARVIVPPLVTAYTIFVVMVVRAWRAPRERTPRASTTRDVVVTIVGGYLVFLAIVLVFHVALAGQRAALRSAVWSGAVLLLGAALLYAACLWTQARIGRNNPLLSDGIKVASVSDGASRLGFASPRPQSTLASDASATEVWVNTDELAIRYASGMRVYIKRWPSGSDPASFYSQEAKDLGVGSTGQINGNPYWAADPRTVPGGQADPFVDISIGKVEIVLTGPIALSDLLATAQTVK